MDKDQAIRIVVASGKGGTGKTTVATSLALSLAAQENVWFLDCDVEAPNGHLFLNPKIEAERKAVVLIPRIDMEKCILCGRCVEVCQYHALAEIGKSILVFPQLCHGCGSCTWNCSSKAIKEIRNPIGVLEAGLAKKGINFAHGVLTISEPMATPIIRQLKKWHKPEDGSVMILDAPPGASCSVVETLHGANFALLVTEPTPFGLHDLKQVIGILGDMKIPAGVIINRDGIGDNQVDEFLSQTEFPILMRIPYSTQIAGAIAAGNTLLDVSPEYIMEFQTLFQKIKNIIAENEPC
ncbi:MAG: ATP-binding protein [Anaerolineales bacterium]|nr:ATP-binding protein [Anaerolineales bacterium]